MIRISISSSRYDDIKTIINQWDFEKTISSFDINTVSDIYIIEVNSIEDLAIIKKIDHSFELLMYVIGPKNFDMINECLRLNINLYLLNNDLISELNRYKEDIYKHIQEKFQYYIYKRNGIYSQIRLSNIYYIESLRHNIIIHSINGEFIERKKLSDILKEIGSTQFVQIHKSYIINKLQIDKITNTDVITKDGTFIPIGRMYKSVLIK